MSNYLPLYSNQNFQVTKSDTLGTYRVYPYNRDNAVSPESYAALLEALLNNDALTESDLYTIL